jgi:tRNA(Ile)-lysidine synthase
VLEPFRRHLNQSGLIEPGTRVLVGYSGGADSTCLLHLLKEAGIDIVAAHLHHGQRPEADQEMRLCEAFCQESDIPFVSGRADVPKAAEELQLGLEEAGRNARYAFFAQAAYRLDCALIATAHTRNDHVETVLLNLTRGAGLAGLAGIPEKRDNIIRPLLPFSRQQTREYCEEHGFWFHDDPANSDFSFSRARVRHRVLPELRSINPNVDGAIARTAELAREEDQFLNGMAAAALEKSEIPLNGKLAFLTSDVEVSFDRALLGSLPAVLFKRAIRLGFGALGASVEHDQTSAVIEGVQGRERGSVTAEGGEVVLEWDLESIGLRKLLPTQPFRYALTLPGETESEEFGWKFAALSIDPGIEPNVRAGFRAELDSAKIKGSLYFRTAKDGDEMQPLGFSGRRKLADLLSEAGLTIAARRRLPIVCDMLGPIWAPGVCLHQRVEKDVDTQKVVMIEFGRL